ncbi:Demethylsterigmatocystin 6-O-methyltransferase, partial [Colletotrichum tanaceti]
SVNPKSEALHPLVTCHIKHSILIKRLLWDPNTPLEGQNFPLIFTEPNIGFFFLNLESQLLHSHCFAMSLSGPNAANTLNSGSTLGSEYLSAVENITADAFASDKDRAEALQATYEAIGRLESPWETFVRIQPAVDVGVKLIKDVGLMPKWHEKSNVPMTSAQLAELVGNCDPELLLRFIRLLASNGFLEQTPDGKFKPNRFCSELANPEFNVLTDLHYLISGDAYRLMPEYLAERGYKNPTDPHDAVVKQSTGHTGDYWLYLRENPKRAESFNIQMKLSATMDPAWTDIYPPQNLVRGSDPKLPLFVDVGGGVGQDLLKLYHMYPEEASRLYLQDLGQVLADSDAKSILPDAVNKLEYDFFTPQPVKGARAYYLRHIIHDWQDEPAREILRMQASAMKPGYSKLLIYNHVLPDQKCPSRAASYDIMMMVYVCGRERTEEQWLALVDSVGLRVTKIWKEPPGTSSVIELEISPS